MVERGAGGAGVMPQEESARKRYQRELEAFERLFGKLPGAREQLDRFVGLLELPRFQAWVQKVFEFDDYSPLGDDYERIEEELADISHRLPAQHGLRKGGGLRGTLIRLLPGNSVTQTNEMDLNAMLAALIALEYPDQFGKEQVTKLYGWQDRVLFGGREFARVVQVPQVTADYYVGLRRTRGLLAFNVSTYASNMGNAMDSLGNERYSEDFVKCSVVLGTSIHLLTVASAYRNGREKCVHDDAYDAIETVIRLFHHSGRLLDLPTPKREGEPYRGCAEIVKFADEAPPGAGGR